MTEHSTDVVILGAGASGLACAEALYAAGVRFEVLEARDRVGGRALTDYALAPGLPLEIGAQMVHGRHVVTHRWIREAGMTVRPWPVSQRALFSMNRRLCRVPWLALPGYPGFGFRAYWAGAHTLPHRLRTSSGPDLSLSDFLDREAPPVGARRIVELLHAHVYAADPDEIGIQGPGEEERRAAEEFGYRNFRLDGGYSELFRRRSRPYQGRIRLGTRVRAIRYREDAVTVETDDGARLSTDVYRARAAVVTFPLGVLKAGSVEFDPPLPEPKQSAIRRIAFGQGYALQLRLSGTDLKDRFGDFSLVWAGGPTTFHRPGVGRHNVPEVVSAFTVGRAAAARARLSPDERVQATLAEFSEALPAGATIGQVAATSVQLWPQDPFAQGAYSFLPVGVGPEERQVLAAPLGTSLFFAGEATEWHGESATIHGAIATGLRAASEVQAALRRGTAPADTAVGTVESRSEPDRAK